MASYSIFTSLQLLINNLYRSNYDHESFSNGCVDLRKYKLWSVLKEMVISCFLSIFCCCFCHFFFSNPKYNINYDVSCTMYRVREKLNNKLHFELSVMNDDQEFLFRCSNFNSVFSYYTEIFIQRKSRDREMVFILFSSVYVIHVS